MDRVDFNSSLIFVSPTITDLVQKELKDGFYRNIFLEDRAFEYFGKPDFELSGNIDSEFRNVNHPRNINHSRNINHPNSLMSCDKIMFDEGDMDRIMLGYNMNCQYKDQQFSTGITNLGIVEKVEYNKQKLINSIVMISFGDYKKSMHLETEKFKDVYELSAPETVQVMLHDNGVVSAVYFNQQIDPKEPLAIPLSWYPSGKEGYGTIKYPKHKDDVFEICNDIKNLAGIKNDKLVFQIPELVMLAVQTYNRYRSLKK